MNITGHTVEKLEDPFGLLEGNRYEFFLDIEVDEDDELYSESGLGLKLIYTILEESDKISQYHFFEKGSGKFFDFSLEEEEEVIVLQYCRDHYQS